MRQPACNQRLMHLPLFRQRAAVVVGQRAVAGEARRPADQHVARPSVEGECAASRSVGGRKVTLPMPPMFCAARQPPVTPLRCGRRTQQQPVSDAHQRRALAAGCDIGDAEIAHRRHARACGYYGRLAKLQRADVPASGHVVPDCLGRGCRSGRGSPAECRPPAATCCTAAAKTSARRKLARGRD